MFHWWCSCIDSSIEIPLVAQLQIETEEGNDRLEYYYDWCRNNTISRVRRMPSSPPIVVINIVNKIKQSHGGRACCGWFIVWHVFGGWAWNIFGEWVWHFFASWGMALS